MKGRRLSSASPGWRPRWERLRAELGSGSSATISWGLGGGGNKLRKLEFLIGEALERDCDTFVTTGGLQSNHARQSARLPPLSPDWPASSCSADVVPIHDADYRANGNLLLDDILGATVHRVPAGADASAAARDRADELRREHRKVYVAAGGGSSPCGTLGYAACAMEILEQERDLGLRFDAIVVANGSSGTHAGLAVGMALGSGGDPRVLSFTVLAPVEEARATTEALACRTLELLAPGQAISGEAIRVDGSQRGEGYGLPTGAMVRALRLMARTQGLLLDPVYSGKAFAGLLDVASSSVWRGRDVLFIMTGGTPGLFAYRRLLADPNAAT